MRLVQTVPDRVLEKTRRSKLGAIAGGPSVEYEEPRARPKPKYTEAERDYKLVLSRDERRVNFRICKSYFKGLSIPISYQIRSITFVIRFENASNDSI